MRPTHDVRGELEWLLADPNWTRLRGLGPAFRRDADMAVIEEAATSMGEFSHFLENVKLTLANLGLDDSYGFSRLDLEAHRLIVRFLFSRAAGESDASSFSREVAGLSCEFLQHRCDAVRDALRNGPRPPTSHPPARQTRHEHLQIRHTLPA